MASIKLPRWLAISWKILGIVSVPTMIFWLLGIASSIIVGVTTNETILYVSIPIKFLFDKVFYYAVPLLAIPTVLLVILSFKLGSEC